MKLDRELLKGTAATLVLTLLADEPAYGYRILRRIRQRTHGLLALGEGTLYPMLYNLESKGWIKGRWQPGIGQRRRRVYAVTAAGTRQLTKRTRQWKTLVTAMNLALGV